MRSDSDRASNNKLDFNVKQYLSKNESQPAAPHFENLTPPNASTSDDSLISLAATCQTPPCFADPPQEANHEDHRNDNLSLSFPFVFPGTQIKADQNQNTFLVIGRPTRDDFSQPLMQLAPFAGSSFIHLLDRIAPFVLTTLIGFQIVPIRLKVFYLTNFELMYFIRLTVVT